MEKALTHRQKILLRGIVQKYIETAFPVGSDYLVKLCRLNCSPATVRNEMSALIDMGYLQQPHTSAGRIPTDKGYRFYVDSLMRKECIAPDDVDHIRQGISKAKGHAFFIFEEVSLILSKISQELAIVLTPQISHAVFDRLELVQLSHEKILVVIHVRNRLVKTVVLEIHISLMNNDLENTARILNERLSGLTLEEIRISIRGRLNDLLNRNWALIQLFIESASDLFDFTSPVEIHTSGTQNIISQPEFSNKNMLEAIFAFVEDKKGLMKMIQSIIQDPSVAIGHENSDSRLKSFSVITSFYKMGNNSGVIGVIGPTRMRYEKIVPLVNRIADTLTEYWS